MGKAVRCGKGTQIKAVELYDHTSPRYLTVTGHRWGGSSETVTEQPDALDWLHAAYFQPQEKPKPAPRKPKPTNANAADGGDGELLERALKAKNGPKLQALLAGDWEGQGFPSQSEADAALCSMLAFWTQDPAQIDRIFRSSGLFRDKWDKRHHADGATYGQSTIDRALANVGATHADHWQERGGGASLGHADGGDATPDLPTVSQCSHLANSHRIRRYYAGRIWYALGVGWIMWTGKFWRPDPTNEGALATGFVDGLSRRIAQEAGIATRQATGEESQARREALMGQAAALMRWAVQTENERNIASGLRLAKHALLIEYDTLNADPWLFNVQNGTVDLRTGKLRPHDPADLITFVSPVVYDPAASCPTFERFIAEVFAGDAEMVAFIQRAIGWSLTGVVKERALFFLYGNAGKNGKTTLIEAVMKLCGNSGETSYGYGRKVGADTFMRSKNSDDNQRKAATLAGPRFICTSEVDEEHRLNEQLIKDITGGDTLEGRRLYQEAFTFKPQFKPWMYGNHKPEIRGTDDAIWSRVRIVEFNVSFHGREDLDLAGKLEAELSGILNWAIKGALSWQRTGLRPPAKVLAATDAYRAEMDVFGPFIAECCVIDARAAVSAKDLWTTYKTWCAENGKREQSQNKLGRYLTAKRWFAEGDKPVKRIGIGLLEKHHGDHYDHYDHGTGNSPKEPFYGDFPDNPRNGRNPRKKSEAFRVQCLNCVHWSGTCGKGIEVENPSETRVCAQFEQSHGDVRVIS
jgi:putative DNA primase/helicase